MSVIFYNFVWQNIAISVEHFTFWAGHSPLGFSHPSLKPILFLSHLKSFPYCYLFRWISWSWFILSMQARGLTSILCSLLVCFGLHMNFSKSDLHFTQTLFFFFFGRLCMDTFHMSVSLQPDKLAYIQQLVLALFWTQPVTVWWVMSFLGQGKFLCPMATHNCGNCVMVI